MTERTNSLTGLAGLIKMSACGREFNGAPILGKLFLNFFEKNLDFFDKI